MLVRAAICSLFLAGSALSGCTESAADDPPSEGEGEGEGGGPDERMRDMCAPCAAGSPCQDERDSCLTFRETNESFCALSCQEGGRCPVGASCLNVGDGVLRCIPNQQSCAGWLPMGWPSSQGAPCSEAEEAKDCTDIATRCLDDLAARTGYCAQACGPDRRCPTGYSSCVDGYCRADWERGPEGCGARSTGPGRGCDDGTCGDDELCITSLADTLPSTVQPFCTRACDTDTDCPDGQSCSETGLSDTGLCLTTACACLARPGAEETLLDQALAGAGLHRCEAIFSDRDLSAIVPSSIRYDPFRLSHFNRVRNYAPGAVSWARGVLSRLDRAASGSTPGAAAIEQAAERLDFPAPNETAPLDAPGAEALPEIIRGFWANSRREPPSSESLLETTASLPEGLADKLALLLAGIQRASQQRDEAFAGLGERRAGILRDLFETAPTSNVIRLGYTGLDTSLQVYRDAVNGVSVDHGLLYGAARDLAALIEALDWSEEAQSLGFELNIWTPAGIIVVRDGEDHLYDPAQDRDLRGELLLLIDTGGDDVYRIPGAANAAWDHPVSVAIDLAGHDRYGFVEEGVSDDPNLLAPDQDGRYDGPGVGENIGPISLSMTARQGGGRLGIALHYDLAGDDVYRSHRMSQGYGVLGVGALIDSDGSDSYQCEAACQGSGSFGVGILLDLGSGSDHYLGFQYVQGFGYTRGYGVVYDQGGDDTYLAVVANPRSGDGTWLFPSAQNPNGGSNSSMAQGMGFGLRADATGNYMSGGIGILRDAGDGDDSYTVDIFGQASGYWYGTGILNDGGGDDSYNGRWYNQGSDAHFALALLLEDGGNDRYNQDIDLMATAVGQGHDVSLGYLVDSAGDDTYTAPGLGLGGGNDNGIGIFIDVAGDDSYDVPDGTTLGGANIGGDFVPRQEAMCLGLFIDGAGEDNYLRFPEADTPAQVGNNRLWTLEQRKPGHRPGERGAGLDAAEGVVGID